MKLTTNFNLNEFNCRDGTEVPLELESNVRLLAAQLQVIRDQIGIPITINSAYRTGAYNAIVGGSPKSQHLLAKAADITTTGHTPGQLAVIVKKLIKEKKILQGGVGIYLTFVHYDIRGTAARWSTL